jgi:hypothetical protein
MSTDPAHPVSPLEGFLRDYLETVGGAWDEVEPEVYDALLPTEVAADSGGMLRLTFAPDALPEHPGAQLASFGTPLVDRLLSDAVERGRSAQFYLIGLNLRPHNLAGKVRAALQLADPLEVRFERVRALHFTQAVYWFRAEFVSDQKEQVLVPVGIDLHHGREVRHLDELLNESRLAADPAQPLPEARRRSVVEGHALAREQALRTITALANVRGRELNARRDQQRRAAIDREEQLRIAELRQKSSLRVQLRLMQMLLVQQPKLLVQGVIGGPKDLGDRLEVVWDPLLEAVEPIDCPVCGRPTFAFERNIQGHAVCPNCASKPAPRKGGR